MTDDELRALATRLRRVENALADALARLPGIRGEVRSIAEAMRRPDGAGTAQPAAGPAAPSALGSQQ